MRNRVLAPLAATVFLSGCAAEPDAPTPAPATTTTTGAIPTATTRVRFAARDAEVVVRVVDNPTSRDFVSKLPMTLAFEEFAGREKISYLPECRATHR